jgi:hypothetical protein
LNADNIPQFSKRVYEAYLSEDAMPGLTVAKVEATDADTGDFGKVRFTSINGPISNKYSIKIQFKNLELNFFSYIV